MFSAERLRKGGTYLTYCLCVLLLIVVVIAAFNPGCLNEDTVDQWGQATVRQYQDWHPATLTILWTYLRYLYDDFQSVLVFQSLLFSTGVFLAVRVCCQPFWRISLFLAVAAVPPVFVYLGFVGSDPAMACFLVLAVGLYYWYKDRRSRVAFCLALFALYMAYAVRHNGVIAVVFLLAMLLLERWRRPSQAAVLTVGILLLFAFLNRMTSVAFRVGHQYPGQALLLYDLSTLSAAADHVLIPEDFRTSYTSLPAIRSAIDPFNDGALFWSPHAPFKFSTDPEAIHRLLAAWARAVVAHPLAYVRWRAEVFQTFAGLRSTMLQPYVESCIVPNTEHFSPVPSPFHEWTMRALSHIAQSALFRPYPYLITLSLLIVLGARRRRADIVSIASSGLCYAVAYFVLISAATFRFACFSVFIALVLVARLAAERAAERDASGPGSGGSLAIRHLIAINLTIAVVAATVARAAEPKGGLNRAGLAGVVTVENGDFEAGTVAPWTAFQDVSASPDTAHARSGHHCLAEHSGRGSVYQDIAGLRRGRSYVVSAWASASTRGATNAYIAVWNPDTNIATFSTPVTLDGEWKLVRHVFTAGTSGTIRLHLLRDGGSGTVYWDDVDVRVLPK